jgi:hypothetical protein
MAAKKINELDPLASPVAADLIVVGDASDSFNAHKVTLTSLTTFLGSSFASTGHSHAAADTGASGFMTGAQFNKLTGIATSATANSTDAFLLTRANHTGTQSTSTLSDFNTNTRAQVEAELAAGSNLTITPSGTGASRVLTLSASGAGISRSTSNVTSSITSGATSILTITLPKSCLVYSIASDKAARIVLYSTAAAATADAGRSPSTAPTAGTGVISQVTLAAAGTQQLDPVATAQNRETSPSNTYSLSVTNNGATGSITVTLGYLSLEA